MCMMTMFIKKFASYLIFGKISLGYKEHEILEMKHITEDLVNIILHCLINLL